jgi:crotonobetainyl-CoA:carnitine CoA-transferase CaiB-like acyl-CoA transferase
MGLADSPPTMAHLAFGDPVGGLFGCAAALTALISRRRTGQGQYVNLSMVEAMLQFTTPSLLAHQLDADSPVRRGNRHAAMAPHGIYPAGGNDRWLAVAIDDAASFAALARLIGRPDWADDASLRELPARRAREDEIDSAISAWSRQQDPQQAAAVLQSAGIAAAPIVHAETLFDVEHFERADFFIDLERAFSGPQRQAGLSIVRDGKRLGARRPAPLLGEHTWEVLGSRASVTPERYQQLLRDGVISFEPAPSRNIVAPQAMIGAN